MSTNSGSMVSNKKNAQHKPVGVSGNAKFRKDGQTGGADMAPGGNMGKGMGAMKNKQAKFGNIPDKNGTPHKAGGPKSDSAYSRSGGQIA